MTVVVGQVEGRGKSLVSELLVRDVDCNNLLVEVITVWIIDVY